MSKSAHVFSTLANDQLYTNYQRNASGVPVPTAEILIKGGAGVANKRLITPLGVATEIAEDSLPELEKNAVFRQHRDAGFLIVRTRSADPDKVASDMNRRDLSAPLTDADYQNPDDVAVKVAAMH